MTCRSKEGERKAGRVGKRKKNRGGQKKANYECEEEK